MSCGFDHILVTSQCVCGQVWSCFGSEQGHWGHTQILDMYLFVHESLWCGFGSTRVNAHYVLWASVCQCASVCLSPVSLHISVCLCQTIECAPVCLQRGPV